jgi:hypothetical protein
MRVISRTKTGGNMEPKLCLHDPLDAQRIDVVYLANVPQFYYVNSWVPQEIHAFA